MAPARRVTGSVAAKPGKKAASALARSAVAAAPRRVPSQENLPPPAQARAAASGAGIDPSAPAVPPAVLERRGSVVTATAASELASLQQTVAALRAALAAEQDGHRATKEALAVRPADWHLDRRGAATGSDVRPTRRTGGVGGGRQTQTGQCQGAGRTGGPRRAGCVRGGHSPPPGAHKRALTRFLRPDRWTGTVGGRQLWRECAQRESSSAAFLRSVWRRSRPPTPN